MNRFTKQCFFSILSFSLLLFSCSNDPASDKPVNSHTSGQLRILADDTFKPLLGTTVETFEAIYPDAGIEVVYAAQEQAIYALLEGKADLAIVGRPLTEAEAQSVYKKGLQPKVNTIASDALVFIVAKENKQTSITGEELTAILSGKMKKQLVCDKSSSGNLLYLKDTLYPTGTLQNIFAAGSDSAVIEYIATHPHAIGIIGMALVSDYDDPKVKARLQKVQLMTVLYKDSTGRTLEGYPVQEELVNGNYPFVRPIYLVNLDGQKNLGTGFANFVVSEKGQKIVLKSGLKPFRMPTRDIIIE